MTKDPYDQYWDAREQEALHSALASLRLAGVDVDAEQLREAAERASGRYSNLSLLDACCDLFRELKVK